MPKPISPPAINHAIEIALLAALATLWGASYSFIKLAVATIPPITLIAARTVIAGTLLVLLMRARGVRLPSDYVTWRRFLVQACLNSVVPFTLIAWAQRSVDASLAVILNSTTPIFAFLITQRKDLVTSTALESVDIFHLILGHLRDKTPDP